MSGKILDWRWPRNNVWFISLMYMFAGGYFLLHGDTWYTRGVAPWLLPLGIGLWLKHSWARWTAMSILSVGLVLAVFIVMANGISWKWCLSFLMKAAFLHDLWVWKVYPESEKDPEVD